MKRQWQARSKKGEGDLKWRGHENVRSFDDAHMLGAGMTYSAPHAWESGDSRGTSPEIDGGWTAEEGNRSPCVFGRRSHPED